jgi:hypothetical protein
LIQTIVFPARPIKPRRLFLAVGLFLFLLTPAGAQSTETDGAGEQEAPYPVRQFHPVAISKIEGSFGFGWQYDKTFYNDGEMFTKGLVILNNIYCFNAGFSFNNTSYYKELTTFFSGDVSLAMVPLRFADYIKIKLLYIYFDNPDYQWRANSLISLLSFNNKALSASFGTHLRWTSFFGEAVIQEGAWAVNITWTPFRIRRLEAGAVIANFDEFFQGNFWDFYLKFFFSYTLGEHITLDNSVALLQTGLDGFTVSFYGFKLRSAIRVTW